MSEIRPIGRLQWYVSSDSRAEMVHLVDFEPTEYQRFFPVQDKPGVFSSVTVEEPTFCSCEAFNMLHHRPCRHQRKVIRYLVNAIPLTGEQREQMTYQLEELCRQSPHWTNPHPEDHEPPKPSPSYDTKRSTRNYHIHDTRTPNSTPPPRRLHARLPRRNP